MERRNILSIIFIATVLITTSETSVFCTKDAITYSCTNITKKNDFPLILPPKIWKVKLIGTSTFDGTFPNRPFNRPSWVNVSELYILEFTNIVRIGRYLLVGLEKLKVLSISSCAGLSQIHYDVFRSTPNLKALYLDRNHHLTMNAVQEALNGKLYNLKYLSLIGIQTKLHPSVLGKKFVKAVHDKNLTYLDISHANIAAFNPILIQKTFRTLRYLNVSYSSLSTLGILQFAVSASSYSIELVDVSGCPFIIQYVLNMHDQNGTCDVPPNVRYLFAKGIQSVGTELKLHFRYNFYSCNTKNIKIKMLNLSENSILILNITFSGVYDFRSLETLDLSKNKMEYISPSVLSSLPSLKILDLSKNQLHNMQGMDDFPHIFSRNKDLEIIFLHNNFLSVVPANIFSSNTKLSIIDLSENQLTYFKTDLYDKWNLKLINLRKNRLKSLPLPFLEQVEQRFLHQTIKNEHEISATNTLLSQFLDKDLIADRYKYEYNEGEQVKPTGKHAMSAQYLEINLFDNPLVCDCDSLDFLKFMLLTNSSIFTSSSLVCKYGNNEYFVNFESFEMVRKICLFPVIIGIIVASLFAIILCLLALVIIQRQRRAKALKKENIEILKKEVLKYNKQFSFIVFLSYCSKDYDIVEKNILPSLNGCFRKIFNTDKDLVCTGDTSFIPGMRIIDEIHRCIDESLVVVPVITSTFLQSQWSQEECVIAIEKHRNVVVLMEQQTETLTATTTIKHLIGNYTRAIWSNNEGSFVIRPSWDKICQGIINTAAETLRNH